MKGSREADDALIRVQCPNPACGKTYLVPASHAGKDGRCKCGAVFPLRNATNAPSGDGASPAFGDDREEVTLRARDALAEVRVGCIGRGRTVIEEDTELGRICRTLSQDLEAIDPWLVPLEGGIAREGRQTLQMQSAR